MLQTIISTLLTNEKFLFWFWGGLGSLSIIFPFNFPSKNFYSFDELVKKSRKFNNIKNHQLMFYILWMVSLAALVLLLSPVNRWSTEKLGVGFRPMMTIFVSSFGIFQATFALSEDVFPAVKTWNFTYGDREEIHRVAKIQLLIVLAVDLFSILFFFLLTWLLP
jgi:hypothetical protein